MQDYNNQASEYGKTTSEYGKINEENPLSQELSSFSDNPQQAEDNLSSAPQNKRNKRKKNFDLNKLLIAFLVTTVAVVSGSTLLSPVNSAKVELREFGVDNEFIFYHLSVESDAPLEVVLYNDFIRLSQPLENGENGGGFEGLKPGLKYNFVVVGDTLLGKREVFKKVVYTTNYKTEWYGVDYYSTVAEDGNFHFTMDFIDDLYYYYDFTATLTDSNGNIYECIFTDDLHSEQTINVGIGDFAVGQATFVIQCTSYEGEEAQTITLFNQEVEV